MRDDFRLADCLAKSEPCIVLWYNDIVKIEAYFYRACRRPWI